MECHIKRLLLIFLFSISISLSAFSNQETSSLWSGKTESTLATSAFYIPRLISNTIKDTLTSRTVNRTLKTATGIIKMPIQPVKASYELADSLLNLPGLLHDIGSDIIQISKNLSSSRYPRSNRIQLCTSNLINNLTNEITPYHYVSPAFHIGAMIDTFLYETTDSQAYEYELRAQHKKSSLLCRDISITSYQSESVSIERLLCVDEKFSFSYDVLDYNCGGYTKDILKMSGLSYPDGINWGVGSEFTEISNTDDYQTAKQNVLKYCDNYILKINQLIKNINNSNHDEELIDYFIENNIPISLDLYFQIMVSSLKNNNFFAIIILDKFIFKRYLKNMILSKDLLIQEKYKSLFINLTQGLKTNFKTNILENKYSESIEIINIAINNKYKSQARKRLKRHRHK